MSDFVHADDDYDDDGNLRTATLNDVGGLEYDETQWEEFPDVLRGRDDDGGGTSLSSRMALSAADIASADVTQPQFNEHCPVCDKEKRGYRGMKATPREVLLSQYRFGQRACDVNLPTLLPWSLIVGCARLGNYPAQPQDVAWQCETCQLWFASENTASVVAARRSIVDKLRALPDAQQPPQYAMSPAETAAPSSLFIVDRTRLRVEGGGARRSVVGGGGGSKAD